MPMTEMEHRDVMERRREQAHPVFTPRAHLGDLSNRTLLYGYDLDRTTVHTYLQDEVVHVVRFHPPSFDDAQNVVRVRSYEQSETLPVGLLIPSKRSYPESCDFEFTLWLMDHGFDPNFTTYGKRRSDPTPYAPFEAYYVGGVWHEQ